MISLIINEKLFIYAILRRRKLWENIFEKDVAACWDCTTFVHLDACKPLLIKTFLDSVLGNKLLFFFFLLITKL